MAPTAASKTKINEVKPTQEKSRKSVSRPSVLNKTFEPKSQNRRMARPGSVAEIKPKDASQLRQNFMSRLSTTQKAQLKDQEKQSSQVFKKSLKSDGQSDHEKE